MQYAIGIEKSVLPRTNRALARSDCECLEECSRAALYHWFRDFHLDFCFVTEGWYALCKIDQPSIDARSAETRLTSSALLSGATLDFFRSLSNAVS